MRFDLNPEQADLVAELDRALDAAPPSADSRELFALLGDRRLLAVHYPTEYGGRNLSAAHQAAIAERLGERGLPDEVHLVTVQGVGCTIAAYGTPYQRVTYLPQIAAGRLFASLLLSEVGAGSDLTGIQTTATPDGTGWRISGEKCWNLRADWSGIGLCSARTRTTGNRYDGVTQFLVDLHAPGVSLFPVPRAMGEPYFSVVLDDVRVGPDAIVGALHAGMSLMMTAIGYERAGFDYLSRARSWLGVAQEEIGKLAEPVQSELGWQVVRLERSVASARAMAFHAANTARDLRMDEVACAYSKLACGNVAQAVARWAGQELLPRLGARADGPNASLLRAAVAEAPELSISGGAFELQLDLIANEPSIGYAVR